MTTSVKRANLNSPDHPFNQSIAEDVEEIASGSRAIESRDKDLVREQLMRDIDAWLAEGNEITKAPPAINDRRSRRVEVHDSKYFF